MFISKNNIQSSLTGVYARNAIVVSCAALKKKSLYTINIIFLEVGGGGAFCMSTILKKLAI